MTMKHWLFATFLLIFASTAAITVLGIINIVQIKDGYLDKLFYMLIAECIGSVVALYKRTDFFGEKVRENENRSLESSPMVMSPPQVETKTKTETPNSVAKTERVFSSLKEYKDRLNELDGFFYEKNQFEKTAEGAEISESGIVKDVMFCTNGVTITIDTASMSSVYAHFPDSFTERVSALRKGDIIVVHGKLSTKHILMIIADSLRVEPKKEAVSVI